MGTSSSINGPAGSRWDRAASIYGPAGSRWDRAGTTLGKDSPPVIRDSEQLGRRQACLT